MDAQRCKTGTTRSLRLLSCLLGQHKGWKLDYGTVEKWNTSTGLRRPAVAGSRRFETRDLASPFNDHPEALERTSELTVNISALRIPSKAAADSKKADEDH